MTTLCVILGVVYGIALWFRRRAFREGRRLTAMDGRMRDLGGRGGF